MISELNKRIKFQIYSVSFNENGFEVEEWTDFKTVWASVNNLFGKEYWEAKTIQAEKTIEFKIRYSKDLKDLNTKKYRIMWDNRIFDITFIDNVKYQNNFLKIKGVEKDV